MGIEEWHADIEITEDTVISLIQEQMPTLNPVISIKYLGEGWDNKIFLVNDDLVFRFPRRTAAMELLERESVILKNMPDFTRMSIPRLKYTGRLGLGYSCPYLVYQMIKGQSGYTASLNAADRKTNVGIIAEFLRELHSIDSEQATKVGVVSQGFGSRSNIPETVRVLRERTDKIISLKAMNINESCLEREIEIAENLVLPDDICLVHGDLDSRHLIFENKVLTGIIDWGDTDITSPAVDLDIMWTFFGPDCHEEFFKIYGPVDPDVWKYARLLGLYCAFSLALYAADLKDSLLFVESADSLRRINPEILRD